MKSDQLANIQGFA